MKLSTGTMQPRTSIGPKVRLAGGSEIYPWFRVITLVPVSG